MHTGAEFVNSSFLTESFCLSYSVAIDIKTNDILCQLRRQSLNNFGFKSFDDNSCLPEHQMLNTLEISLQEELLTTILITFSDDCFFLVRFNDLLKKVKTFFFQVVTCYSIVLYF